MGVSPFRPKDAEQTVFEQQLRKSIDVAPLVNAVFWHDMKLGRVAQLARLGDLTHEAQAAVYDRAVVASNLGDPAMRGEMNEQAARAAMRGLVGRRLGGGIADGSPLLELDLDDLRLIATLAVFGALAYATGNPPLVIEEWPETVKEATTRV